MNKQSVRRIFFYRHLRGILQYVYITLMDIYCRSVFILWCGYIYMYMSVVSLDVFFCLPAFTYAYGTAPLQSQQHFIFLVWFGRLYLRVLRVVVWGLGQSMLASDAASLVELGLWATNNAQTAEIKALLLLEAFSLIIGYECQRPQPQNYSRPFKTQVRHTADALTGL